MSRPGDVTPDVQGTGWIDALSDEQCAEIFWLYVESPDDFLKAYPPALLGHAMRYALRCVAETSAGRLDSAPRPPAK